MSWQDVKATIIANGWAPYTFDQIYSLWYSTYNHLPPPPMANPNPITSLDELAQYIASLI